MNKVQWKMDTVIGPLYLVATDDALQGIFWKKKEAPVIASYKDHKILTLTIKQIEEYLSGKRTHFDMPLELIGTPFQKRVWKFLTEIPYGETCSYKDIALKMKDGNASRAVGTANGKNPISIIVPCHRVITSSGTLGGYAGGLRVKQKLLDLEQTFSQ